MDNKKILSITLAALIILNIVTYFNLRSMKSNLESRIENLNGQIMRIDNAVNGQTSSINHTLSQMKEEQKWTGDAGYKLLDYDDKTGVVKVSVNWSFRELQKGSNVYISYGEKEKGSANVGNWDRVEASPIDKLNYNGEIYLSSDKDYKLKVQSENNGGSKGEDLIDIDMNDIISGRLQLVPSMDHSRGPRYEHHMFVVNNHQGAEFLKIKSARANIYVKGKLENTVELHRQSPGDVSDDMIKKFDADGISEIWLNDEAVWVKGEENWVKTGENSWTNNSGSELPGPMDVGVEVIITDNMGKTYTKSFRY